jgi:hypothetical protein
MSEDPDVFVVLRQHKGGRPLLAFHGAVYPTHKEAMNAMNKHKDALKKFNPKDARDVYVKRSSKPRRFR